MCHTFDSIEHFVVVVVVVMCGACSVCVFCSVDDFVRVYKHWISTHGFPRIEYNGIRRTSPLFPIIFDNLLSQLGSLFLSRLRLRRSKDIFAIIISARWTRNHSNRIDNVRVFPLNFSIRRTKKTNEKKYIKEIHTLRPHTNIMRWWFWK